MKTDNFINPYNFIPLNKENPRLYNERSAKEESNTNDDHTGYFECVLTTKTPLSIPDAAKEYKVNEHPHYPFMKIAEVPTIPGSSLRGPIRSVYETLTNSCMVTMDSDEQITRRSDLGTFEPCILKREEIKDNVWEWRLYKAERIPLVCDENSVTHYKIVTPPSGSSYKSYRVDIDEDGKYITDSSGNRIHWGDEVDIDPSGPGHDKILNNGGRYPAWKNTVKDIRLQDNTDSFMYFGEMISGKHAESVFKVLTPKKDLGFENDVIRKALDGLKYAFRMYNSKSVNRNLKSTHLGYRGFERLIEKGIVPLWYKEKNGRLYLSLAAIGRIAYYNTLSELALGHDPCTDRKCLCPACSVFGMVGKGRNEDNEINAGRGSRVRFTDAKALGEADQFIMSEEATLKELSTPRTSYLKFYSTEGKEYDDIGATIRGRKYYWHIPATAYDSGIYSTCEKTDRNASVELVKPEKEFGFRVYYEHLNAEQVNMLAFTLVLGGEESDVMHKIGHGKPLGLGSVKIGIKKRFERNYGENGYNVNELEIDNDMPKGLLDVEAWNKLKIIGKYSENSKKKICYPFVGPTDRAERTIAQKKGQGWVLKENVLAAHKWFSNNTTILPQIDPSRSFLTNQVIDVGERDFVIDRQHANNRGRTAREADALQMNGLYWGKVESYNPQKTSAYIKLETGKNVSLFYREVNGAQPGKIDIKLPVDTDVQLKYKGKQEGNDGRSHDKWELMR